jgi:superfamily II helicase
MSILLATDNFSEYKRNEKIFGPGLCKSICKLCQKKQIGYGCEALKQIRELEDYICYSCRRNTLSHQHGSNIYLLSCQYCNKEIIIRKKNIEKMIESKGNYTC